jgi:(1->4)-alpha-D-glucan 1-alpha-D-glucosylmutase
VPDLYQGAELWDLSLVDPDNRRPVDYERRNCLLEHSAASMRDLLHNWQDGAVKLHLTARLLKFRASDPDLFALGDYRPLTAAGPKADCICAFERHHDGRSVVVAAARFPARRAADPDWSGTTIQLPPHLEAPRLSNLLNDAEVGVDDGQLYAGTVFRDLPVALLAM